MEAERDIIERLTKLLDDPTWQPRRAHIESARNALSEAASTIETLRGERDEAVKLFRQRYISEDLVKLVGYALRDLNAEIETVCRLRGEADANADLKRFVHYVDHEPSLSRGAVSSIIDFAQGQMARAEKAEAEVSTLLVKLEGVEKALEPFATVGRLIEAGWGPRNVSETDAFQSGAAWRGPDGETKTLTWGDFTRARRTLSQLREEKGTGASRADLDVEPTFQARVEPWMRECFGDVIPFDRVERGDRLLEEVFELLQSGGYDPARIAALRDYTWGRPAGEPSQEVGGVMVTLAAYCLAFGLDMHRAGETELARITRPEMVLKIRAKQAAKPTGSALPIASPDAEPSGWRPTRGEIWALVCKMLPGALLFADDDSHLQDARQRAMVLLEEKVSPLPPPPSGGDSTLQAGEL